MFTVTLFLTTALPGFTACSPGDDAPVPGGTTPAPTPDPSPDPSPDPTPEPEPPAEGRLHIVIGGATFTATLSDNAAARAFEAMLPMSIRMDELNGNEKYYYLPSRLPAAASSPGTIRTGDLMLYGSDCLVLFYKTFRTSYKYTPLGRVDDPSGLETALGAGAATVSFERAR